MRADQAPESLNELIALFGGRAIPRLAPYGRYADGAAAAGVKERNAMTAGSVKGSAGRGELYGRGPLIVNDPRYPEVNGLGLVHNSGRVDSFAWDPQGERLFAAVASGGVWRWDDLAKTWQSATGKPAHLGHRCGGVDAGGRRQAPDADR